MIEFVDLRTKPMYDTEIAAMHHLGLKPYRIWRVLSFRYGESFALTQRTVYRKVKKLREDYLLGKR
jgi:hypothetical protein